MPVPAHRRSTSEGDFTAYVRELTEAPEEPDASRFEVVWVALRKALAHELGRRGLWQAPPSYLGVYGFERWPIDRDDDGPATDALEELAADCYTWVFVTRLQSLTAQLRVKPSIEGLVFRSIRNFLHDRQKRFDPLGYRVYEALRVATEMAIEAGVVRVASGHHSVRNDALLRVNDEAAVDTSASGLTWQDTCGAWADELLPDVVTARGAARVRVHQTLADRLPVALTELGGAVRFKVVIDLFKQAVRARWAHLFADAAGPGARADEGRWCQLSGDLLPATGWEERQHFAALVACVEDGLAARADGPAAGSLQRLWRFLRTFAAEPDLQGAARPPSRRGVARALAIPRDRLPGFYALLGDLVRDCRHRLSGSERSTERVS